MQSRGHLGRQNERRTRLEQQHTEQPQLPHTSEGWESLPGLCAAGMQGDSFPQAVQGTQPIPETHLQGAFELPHQMPTFLCTGDFAQLHTSAE